jgi:hypothetical protein
MTRQAWTPIVTLMIILVALVATLPVTAAPRPSSDLLLPYFEVDLNGGLTTLFAVVNSSDEAVTARISVYSNWGVEVLTETVLLNPDKVRTINLADWLVNGNLPNKTLRGDDLQHVQAALTGEASLKSGMYYSSPVKFQRAVGYIEIHITSSPRHDSLWGDYFVVDPRQDFAQGEILVNIDRTTECGALCTRRALRFLTGGAFDGGTEVVIWTGRHGAPSLTGFNGGGNTTQTKTAVYNEEGDHIDDRSLEFRPVEVLTVAELGLTDPFGWLDVQAETEFFMAVRYTASNRFSVGLVSHCLEVQTGCAGPNCGGGGGDDPRIRLEKATNGVDADHAPGVHLDRNGAVEWSYRVTNTGNTPLTDVTVTDDDPTLLVDCPSTVLTVGQSMTCTATGTAHAKNYRNVGTAVGTPPQGPPVSDDDPSHYNTSDDPPPAILLEKYTNGADADNAPGIELQRDAAVTWTYVVTNTGEVPLANVAVTDDDASLTVHCPKAALEVAESMTCTATGTAKAKNYRNVGTAVGTPPQGPPVRDEDPSHYNTPDPTVEHPSLHIEKATNGHDADVAPGPELAVGDAVTWTYVVTNTGDVTLSNIEVTDDQGVSVSCPKSTLEVGQSMTCTGQGTAIAGQYKNVGKAVGDSPAGNLVWAEDCSHYYGQEPFGGRMTGGGSVFTDADRYTHGFELHCDTSLPNNLEINWGKGEKFHLTLLTSGVCSDDPTLVEAPPVAGFDTFVGTGVGRLNGIDGATIEFLFTDAGEPGKDDWAEFRITPPAGAGGTVVTVSGYLHNGNHQAHAH